MTRKHLLLMTPTYIQKVLGIEPGNLIAYWPMSEPSGGIAINAEGTAARNGAYTGVTLAQPGIGDGNTCPLFDGANDFNNVYSASLDAAFIFISSINEILIRVMQNV